MIYDNDCADEFDIIGTVKDICKAVLRGVIKPDGRSISSENLEILIDRFLDKCPINVEDNPDRAVALCTKMIMVAIDHRNRIVPGQAGWSTYEEPDTKIIWYFLMALGHDDDVMTVNVVRSAGSGEVTFPCQASNKVEKAKTEIMSTEGMFDTPVCTIGETTYTEYEAIRHIDPEEWECLIERYMDQNKVKLGVKFK